jgi:hypothetical protein
MGLDDDPFAWRITADGTVMVSRGGRHVVTVAGAKAAKLISVLESGDHDAAQHALARATGNYRRGNERPTRRR